MFSKGELLVHISGIGRHRAEQSAERLVNHGVRALVSWGTAAGLDPALHPGALLLPREIYASTGARHLVDTAWAARLSDHLNADLVAHTGMMAHADHALTDPTEKSLCRRESGAIAADMESLAVAEVAANAGLPFIVVRSVADPHAASIPRCVIDNIDQYGRASMASLLYCITTNPTQLRHLIRLALAFRKAIASLTIVADIAGPRLCH